MRAAIVKNGVVQDLIIVSSVGDFPECIACPDHVSIGMAIDAPYVEPSPLAAVIPQRVEMAQARLALLESGYLSAVETAMASMPKSAQIEWEFRSHVARQSSLVSAMQSLLQLTDQQVDELFVLAAGK